jgi:hypothetical protein
MESSGLYSNMQARLATIKMSDHERAQAERHMERAAMIVGALLGGKRGKSAPHADKDSK